jgi:hypothetical protein
MQNNSSPRTLCTLFRTAGFEASQNTSRIYRRAFVHSGDFKMKVLLSKKCRNPPITTRCYCFQILMDPRRSSGSTPWCQEATLAIPLSSYSDIHQHLKCHGYEVHNAICTRLTVEKRLSRSQGSHPILEVLVSSRPPVLKSFRKDPCIEHHTASLQAISSISILSNSLEIRIAQAFSHKSGGLIFLPCKNRRAYRMFPCYLY